MKSEKEKASIEDDASAAFLQPSQGEWTREDQVALEGRLSADPTFAEAYQRAGELWSALDVHAGSPELLRRREEAISYARQVNGRRWLKPIGRSSRPWRLAAAAFAVALLLATLWQLSPYGYLPGQYRTNLGERRVVQLEDHSQITLDAVTRLRVRYSPDARLIELEDGQAQFSVAQDPTRPFKVRAGDRTIVALGTVFTVEFVDHQVRVAMLEGRVAVVPNKASQPIELSAGQELRVASDGRSKKISKADLEAATAWQDGKVIFRAEPLGEAVHRLNRYSRVQIEVVDPSLAAEPISGVFEAGNAARFVDALQRSMPIVADSSEDDTIRLRSR
jgi:transmembrane sensor